MMWTLVLPVLIVLLGGHSSAGRPSRAGIKDWRKKGNNCAAKKSGKKQNTNDSLDSDDFVQVQFQTPCKRSTTFVEQIKTAEKIRYLMYVLDDELQLLSPPSFMNTKHAADQLSKIPGKTAENMHD